eukprot:357001-Chlamydomonas_euryale.AAC.12
MELTAAKLCAGSECAASKTRGSDGLWDMCWNVAGCGPMHAQFGSAPCRPKPADIDLPLFWCLKSVSAAMAHHGCCQQTSSKISGMLS